MSQVDQVIEENGSSGGGADQEQSSEPKIEPTASHNQDQECRQPKEDEHTQTSEQVGEGEPQTESKGDQHQTELESADGQHQQQQHQTSEPKGDQEQQHQTIVPEGSEQQTGQSTSEFTNSSEPTTTIESTGEPVVVAETQEVSSTRNEEDSHKEGQLNQNQHQHKQQQQQQQHEQKHHQGQKGHIHSKQQHSMRSSSRRPSYNNNSSTGRVYASGYQNYGLAYLPYKSNFEPSEDAKRKADEFLQTLKL